MDYSDIIEIVKSIATVIVALASIGGISIYLFRSKKQKQENYGNITAPGGIAAGNMQGSTVFLVNQNAPTVKLSDEAARILKSIPPDSSLEFLPQEHHLFAYSNTRNKREIPYSNDSVLKDALAELVECEYIKTIHYSQHVRTYQLTAKGRHTLSSM